LTPEPDTARSEPTVGLPRHIAIIMDGNGRWARARGLPRIEGHRQGDRSIRAVVERCGEVGVSHLTLYGFSTENWRRSSDEVQFLMRLFEVVARREIDALHQKGVRVRVLGRMDELPKSLREELLRDCELTRENTGLTLNLALNYGGRAEIVDAVRELARRVARGELAPEAITEGEIAAALYLPDTPEPDLLIRTGGEYRLSNFLLWQSAYAELWVTQTLWPDFGRDHLDEALLAYQRRERRFGAAPVYPI
jgi:undecaprenyl diphosphate synthase